MVKRHRLYSFSFYSQGITTGCFHLIVNTYIHIIALFFQLGYYLKSIIIFHQLRYHFVAYNRMCKFYTVDWSHDLIQYRQRTAIQCHIVQRRHKQRLLYKVGIGGLHGCRKQVYATFTHWSNTQKIISVLQLYQAFLYSVCIVLCLEILVHSQCFHIVCFTILEHPVVQPVLYIYVATLQWCCLLQSRQYRHFPFPRSSGIRLHIGIVRRHHHNTASLVAKSSKILYQSAWQHFQLVEQHHIKTSYLVVVYSFCILIFYNESRIGIKQHIQILVFRFVVYHQHPCLLPYVDAEVELIVVHYRIVAGFHPASQMFSVVYRKRQGYYLCAVCRYIGRCQCTLLVVYKKFHRHFLYCRRSCVFHPHICHYNSTTVQKRSTQRHTVCIYIGYLLRLQWNQHRRYFFVGRVILKTI